MLQQVIPETACWMISRYTPLLWNLQQDEDYSATLFQKILNFHTDQCNIAFYV